MVDEKFLEGVCVYGNMRERGKGWRDGGREGKREFNIYDAAYAVKPNVCVCVDNGIYWISPNYKRWKPFLVPHS